jgi:hypothetical protein
MVKGKTQVVEVRSVPPGATVEVQPGKDSFITPSKVALHRKSSYVVRIGKGGYVTETVALESKASRSLWRNAVWIHPIGWIIGVSVDLTTGAGYAILTQTRLT